MQVFGDGAFNSLGIRSVNHIHLFSIHKVVKAGNRSNTFSIHKLAGISRGVTNHLEARGATVNERPCLRTRIA